VAGGSASATVRRTDTRRGDRGPGRCKEEVRRGPSCISVECVNREHSGRAFTD
jgi:hypothetical protein